MSRSTLGGALLLVLLLVAAACGASVEFQSTGSEGTPPTPAPTATATATVAPSPSATPTTPPEPTPTATAEPAPDPTPTVAPPPPAVPLNCDIGPVPESAGLDPFYVQGCSVGGFWIVAGQPVDPQTIETAAVFVKALFEYDPELGAAIAATGIRLGIIGLEQLVSDMPEYRTLAEDFPEIDWDNEVRGLGATADYPLTSVGEENLLCLSSDIYIGEDILLHEFAHAIHEQGLSALDPTFDARLETAFNEAVGNGLWDDTYASSNRVEYWAEGVQSYFDRNYYSAQTDGIHGPVWNNASLREHDLRLYLLVEEKLGGFDIPATCQVSGPN